MPMVAEVVEPKASVKFQRVLIATDFSNASRQALAYALAIAKRFNSEIVAVHAVAPEPREAVPMDPLPKELDRRRAEAEHEIQQLENAPSFNEVMHRTIVERGSVWDVLSDVFQHAEIDLLVMGTHGRGVLKKLALGSVAEAVLRLAACPVLTVGPKALPPRGDKADFKTILFATDFGPAAATAFPYALFLAESCGAKLVLLHMVPPLTALDAGPVAFGPAAYMTEDFTAWHQQVREEGIRRLKDLIPAQAKLASQPEYLVETNFLPEGILETAGRHQADLIVMGANRARAPRLASHIPWALTHDALCEAACPVLTVRAGG